MEKMDAPESHADAPAAKRVAAAVVHSTDENYRVEIQAGRHRLTADEPQVIGGADAGPPPFGLLLSALGSCTVITLRMYAQRKGWPLSDVRVRLGYEKGAESSRITRRIALAGDLDDAQRARLLDVAERTPVTLAVRDGVPIATSEDRD
jgi:putative redox protein